MTSRGNVRTHRRQLPGGGTTTVGQHRRAVEFGSTAKPTRGPLARGGRRTRKRTRGGWFQARRALQTFGWAIKAARKHKGWTAVGLAGVGAAELAGWAAFRGTGLALTSVGFLLAGAGTLAMHASRAEPPSRGGRRPASGPKRRPPAKGTVRKGRGGKTHEDPEDQVGVWRQT